MIAVPARISKSHGPRRAAFRTRPFSPAILGFAAVPFFCADALGDPTPGAQRLDQGELRLLESRHPHAFEQFEAGQRLFASGDAARAAEFFRRAAAEAPESPLVARRSCEALAAIGAREEALADCQRAIAKGSSVLDLRATVGALMSGSRAPTTDDVGQALLFARAVRNSAPNEPWGYAAECDIAVRLGDARMFDDCLEELRDVAPRSDETRHFEAIAASHSHQRWVRLGWFLILISCVVTAIDAVRRARRRARSAVGIGVAALVLSSLLAVVPKVASASEATRPASSSPSSTGLGDWPIDDQNPTASVPTPEQRDKNPLQFGYFLIDVAQKADDAAKQGNHRAAMEYYRALTLAVPDRSVAFGKLCTEYEALGDREHALRSCADALGKPGAQDTDFAHYVHVVFEKHGALDEREVASVDGVVQHLRKAEGSDAFTEELACELAVRIDDVHRLEGCAAALAASAPNEPSTVSFEWALAISRGDAKAAEAWVERAKALHVGPDVVARMEQATRTLSSSWRRHIPGRGALWAVSGALLLVAIVIAVVSVRRRRLVTSTS